MFGLFYPKFAHDEPTVKLLHVVRSTSTFHIYAETILSRGSVRHQKTYILQEQAILFVKSRDKKRTIRRLAISSERASDVSTSNIRSPMPLSSSFQMAMMASGNRTQLAFCIRAPSHIWLK